MKRIRGRESRPIGMNDVKVVRREQKGVDLDLRIVNLWDQMRNHG